MIDVEASATEDEGGRGIKHARFQVAGSEVVAGWLQDRFGVTWQLSLIAA